MRSLVGAWQKWVSWRTPPAYPFSFCYENVLGTSFELQVSTPDTVAAANAEQVALAEIDRLEAIFSRFLPGSEFWKWQDNPGVSTPLSDELFDVLTACDVWRERSAGAFQPATEVLSGLWRTAARENRLPDAETIATAREQILHPPWQLDAATRTGICYAAPLTLHGIAKGYIVDRVCESVLQSDPAITDVLVNIGGDLCVRGDRKVSVGVSDPHRDAENTAPFAVLLLKNAAMATSGDWRRGFHIGGTLYSHILDGRTGNPVDRMHSASVVATTAMEADVLATIFSIVSPSESLAIANALPDVGCLLIARSGETYQNARWETQEVSR